MGYKLLGFAVWQGGKRYLRRRFPHARNVAIAGGAGLLLAGSAGAALTARRRSSAQ